MPNPLAIAAQGKGYPGLAKRARAIKARYGFTIASMQRALDLFASILQKYDCGATFPITASPLGRHGAVIRKLQSQNMEFALHGLVHVDYSQLTLERQQDHIKEARRIFQQQQIKLSGFRCPYLRWNQDILTAVASNNLEYDSSSSLHWDVVGRSWTEDYQGALTFYGAESAENYPALPRAVGQVVQIPYSLPDDEALIERLTLSNTKARGDVWLGILERTHSLGELFILGLHPERTGLLQEPLAAVLAKARDLSPPVWIGRLDEIARWWRARSQATFELMPEADNTFHLTIKGPPGTTILVRNANVQAPVERWHNGFDRVLTTSFRFQANKRPCVGLSPESDPRLNDFLRQQGYWVEASPEVQAYTLYLDQTRFVREDERPLLRRLSNGQAPLIRLGRWPDGAQSAMCITGDIDALNLWDYGLRLFGK